MDAEIHRFTWHEAQNPYLVETLERYFSLSLRIWYLVIDRVLGLAARSITRSNCWRRSSIATPRRRAAPCASTCSSSSARCCWGSAAPHPERLTTPDPIDISEAVIHQPSV